MRLPNKVLLAGLLVGVVPALSAQTIQQSRTYVSLLNTPVGALPPVYSSVGVGSVTSGPGLALRYGRHEFRRGSLGLDNFGLTADLGARFSDKTQLTVGVITCSGCDNTWMGGANFYAELERTPLGNDPQGGVLSFGVRPDFGVGHTLGSDAWYWSASLDMPIALETRIGPNIRFEPFLAPGAGYGMIAANGADVRGTVVPTLGGGVGLYTNSGLGLHVGGHRIFVDNATTQWGLGLSWRDAWR